MYTRQFGLYSNSDLSLPNSTIITRMPFLRAAFFSAAAWFRSTLSEALIQIDVVAEASSLSISAEVLSSPRRIQTYWFSTFGASRSRLAAARLQVVAVCVASDSSMLLGFAAT